MLRLYTFVISHFSEKARWALDFEGLTYEEERLLPGPHMLVIRTRAKATTVPLLEHDGTYVQGSGAIIDYLGERLGASRLAPAPGDVDRSNELERLADRAFGQGIQRIFYETLLAHPKTVTDLWCQDGPAWGRPFYTVAYRGMAMAIRRMYKIAPDAVTRAKGELRAAMDVVDSALAERPYLNGEAPGRADITVASLLAPMVCPPGHLVRWPELVPPLSGFVTEFSGRPTWNHVVRMYRDHRKAPAQGATGALRAS